MSHLPLLGSDDGYIVSIVLLSAQPMGDMDDILHTATSLIPPETPFMAFENRFSTSAKLFRACSSLTRDRRGCV
jgi:hypothetical protein